MDWAITRMNNPRAHVCHIQRFVLFLVNIQLSANDCQAFYASVVIYNIAMCIIKIGILLQYRRVFAVRMIQIITFYGTILMICWTIIIAFINIFICVPVSKFWTPDLPGRCLDSLAIWYMMAGFNLVTDLVVFCMPLPVIKSLNLPRKQKMMLFAIFSLGFL